MKDDSIYLEHIETNLNIVYHTVAVDIPNLLPVIERILG